MDKMWWLRQQRLQFRFAFHSRRSRKARVGFRDKANIGDPSNSEGKDRVKRLRLAIVYLLAPAGAPVWGDSLPS